MDDNCTALLAEDTENDSELTLAARDGQEAMDYLYRRAVPTQISKMMPLDTRSRKIDALEALHRIEPGADLKATPVAALTSSREGRDLLRRCNLSTNAYEVKPMSFQFFTQTVKEVGLFWGVIKQPPSAAEREH